MRMYDKPIKSKQIESKKMSESGTCFIVLFSWFTVSIPRREDFTHTPIIKNEIPLRGALKKNNAKTNNPEIVRRKKTKDDIAWTTDDYDK